MAKIIPYIGFENYLFSKSFDEIHKELKDSSASYTIEHWPNKGCTPEVAWDIIRVGDSISLFFAKGCLFKIYFENSFEGSLFNGIHLGQKIDDAISIDGTLQYDDWEEEYISELGYWLEDEVGTGKIISISIFIKAIEDDEYFYSYEWCDVNLSDNR